MIYLIRHGQTAYNKKEILQGWMDVSLDEEGVHQATRLAEHLTHVHADVILSSDLKRAYQTAEITAKMKNMHVKKVRSLREIRLGSWEGKTMPEVKSIHHTFFEDKTLHHEALAVHGGESLIAFQKRVIASFMRLMKRYKNKDVFVFTHGGNIRMFLLHLDQIPIEQRQDVKIDNCSITALSYDPKTKEIKQHQINDRSYL